MSTYAYKDQSSKTVARLPIAVSQSDLIEIDSAAKWLGLNRSSFVKMAIKAQINALGRHE